MIPGHVILAILLAGAAISSATLDCPDKQFWNGTDCALCSGCPLGFGLKVPCSDKKDTQCEVCESGYSYSDTSGMDECILCDTYSNCLAGKPKLVKKCTIFSPPICDGCEDGYYKDLDLNGCVECSPRCAASEEEVRQCTTEQDRICGPRRAVPTTPVLSNNSKDKEILNSTSQTVTEKNDEIEPIHEEPTADGSSTQAPQENLNDKDLKIWLPAGAGVVGVVVLTVTVPIIYKAYRKKEGARRGKRNKETDILLKGLGLDRPIKKLAIEEKKTIVRELNGKDIYGYFHWRATAEKLDPDLGIESRGWEGSDHPIDKLLTAYGEKEGSTIRRLIQAIREVGLTHCASKLEQEFDTTTQNQGEVNDITDTIDIADTAV